MDAARGLDSPIIAGTCASVRRRACAIGDGTAITVHLHSEAEHRTWNLVDARETAAVLALIGRRDLPWNRVAGMVEEAGSALALLAQLDDTAQQQLLVEEPRDRPNLDELQGRVEQWEAEGI